MNINVIDLSGYSFSGKSAVYDLLMEFEDYSSFGSEFEFDLLRMPGGILDLEVALVSNWSPVRSSEAIRRFKKLTRKLSGNRSFLAKLTSIGTHYDCHFFQFSSQSREYIDSLVQSSWSAEWPFALCDLSSERIILKKLLRKLGNRNSFEFDVYLSRMSQEDFTELTCRYLEGLFEKSSASNKKNIVLNNAFEPFQPLNSQKFFNNVKSIIVDRDPRDIYISAYVNGWVGGSNVGKAVTGKNVEDFISRFKLYRQSNDNQNKNVLKIQFEDIILDYDSTVSRILNFLQESPDIHKNKKKIFSPEFSKRNVSMWKTSDFKLGVQINRIENELADYCIDL